MRRPTWQGYVSARSTFTPYYQDVGNRRLTPDNDNDHDTTLSFLAWLHTREDIQVPYDPFARCWFISQHPFCGCNAPLTFWGADAGKTHGIRSSTSFTSFLPNARRTSRSFLPSDMPILQRSKGRSLAANIHGALSIASFLLFHSRS